MKALGRMRTRASGNVDISPWDCAIRIPPGSQIFLDESVPTVPDREQLAEWMARIRGAVLSKNFELEHALMMVQLAGEFGTLDSSIGGPTFIEKSKAMRRDTSLQRKIEGAKPHIRSHLSVEAADRLSQDLAEFRRVRNLMAHRQAWLEGIWGSDAGKDSPLELPEGLPAGRTIGFTLHIADDDFAWQITEEQTVEWLALVDRCLREVDAVRQAALPT
jgi:hypothetical protein